MIGGRQRVIKDNFWRDPALATLTTEDKYGLLYLHSSPFSNTIGVYSFVPSIMAAELGWDTNSQLWPVLQRLADKDLLAINVQASYLWVKTWWGHNAANGLGATVKTKAVREIQVMPADWQLEYIHDLLPRLLSNQDTYKWFKAELTAALPGLSLDRLPLAYPSSTDGQARNTNLQTKSISNSAPASQAAGDAYKLSAKVESQMNGLSEDQKRTIRHQVARSSANGGIRTSPEIYAQSLITMARKGLLVPCITE